MEIMWRVISWKEKGENGNGRKGAGIKSINGRYKIDRGKLRKV